MIGELLYNHSSEINDRNDFQKFPGLENYEVVIIGILSR